MVQKGRECTARFSVSDEARARLLLEASDLTCVLCKGERTHASSERGIKPLLTLFDDQTDVQGFSAADKVVGNGAAHLYVLLGVASVFAQVMSVAARQTLEQNGITASCEKLVAAIVNRMGDGLCPIEQSVSGIDDSLAACEAIRHRLVELAKTTEPDSDTVVERIVSDVNTAANHE